MYQGCGCGSGSANGGGGSGGGGGSSGGSSVNGSGGTYLESQALQPLKGIVHIPTARNHHENGLRSWPMDRGCVDRRYDERYVREVG